MNISRSGGFGGLTQVRMRGSEANHTLVLLDGFELNDPANGSEYDFAHLRGTSIERIEYCLAPWALGEATQSPAPSHCLRHAHDAMALRQRASCRRASMAPSKARYAQRTAERAVTGCSLSIASTPTARMSPAWVANGTAMPATRLRSAGHISSATSSPCMRRFATSTRRSSSTLSPFPAFIPMDGDRETELKRTLLGLRGE